MTHTSPDAPALQPTWLTPDLPWSLPMWRTLPAGARRWLLPLPLTVAPERARLTAEASAVLSQGAADPIAEVVWRRGTLADDLTPDMRAAGWPLLAVRPESEWLPALALHSTSADWPRLGEMLRDIWRTKVSLQEHLRLASAETWQALVWTGWDAMIPSHGHPSDMGQRLRSARHYRAYVRAKRTEPWPPGMLPTPSLFDPDHLSAILLVGGAAAEASMGHWARTASPRTVLALADRLEAKVPPRRTGTPHAAWGGLLKALVQRQGLEPSLHAGVYHRLTRWATHALPRGMVHPEVLTTIPAWVPPAAILREMLETMLPTTTSQDLPALLWSPEVGRHLLERLQYCVARSSPAWGPVGTRAVQERAQWEHDHSSDVVGGLTTEEWRIPA